MGDNFTVGSGRLSRANKRRFIVTLYLKSHWTLPLQNPVCAQHYDDIRFSIFAQGHSPFHLSALEATFIKTSNPALCRQKEFVYNLKIVL